MYNWARAGVLMLTAFWASALAEQEDPMAYIKGQELKHAKANGVDIAYKTLGDEAGPPVLMIMGLGATHITWGDQVLRGLEDAGYRVIVFDNRDVGESQQFDEYGDPWLMWEFIKAMLGFEVGAHYTLEDMADDSVGLLDALGIERAHVVGASMGGMIAQIVTAKYPERALSLTSIMSSSGAEHLPEAEGDADDDVVDVAGQEMPELEAMGIYPEAMPRQLLAIMKTGDRSELLTTIDAPTLVVHGAKDMLLPLPHGEHTAEMIEGSRLVVYEEMGHDFPEEVVPRMLEEMKAHFKQAGEEGT